MNAKEIQDMAYKAKFWTADTSFGGVCWMGNHAELQRFASLIAAHEREACAKVVADWDSGLASDPIPSEMAEAIRARGQA
jgi:hypothetical protein